MTENKDKEKQILVNSGIDGTELLQKALSTPAELRRDEVELLEEKAEDESLSAEERETARLEAIAAQKKRFPAPPEPSKFHRQPVDWQKGAGAMVHMNDRMNNLEQQKFHRVALNEVRKALGPKCTHLIHVKKHTGEVIVRAKLRIDGKITTFNVDLGDPNPDNWVAETYKSLNDTLKKHLKNVTGS